MSPQPSGDAVARNPLRLRAIRLGLPATAYVAEQLELAADGFAGPLAAALRLLPLEDPLAMLPSSSHPAASDVRSGGLLPDSAAVASAEALCRWIHAPDADRQRLLLLEESLGRLSDPGTPAGSLHLGDTIYQLTTIPTDAAALATTLESVYGYPGIGVLSRPPVGLLESQLTERALAQIIDATVAVLVRAWDDEGFITVPVHERLLPRELDPPGL